MSAQPQVPPGVPVAGASCGRAVASVPGASKPDPILAADHVRRQFGGLIAVDVEHLEVQRHWVTSLIGPNGAGKSTLFNVLSGFDRPKSGRWRHDDRDLSGRAASSIARHGLVRTFQHTKTLANLTVLENVKLAAGHQRGERLRAALLPWRWRRQEKDIEERAMVMLERFRLEHMAQLKAGRLSGGQRKLLEMARAIMAAPNLLLLDEPMAGVTPTIREALLDHISQLRAEGVTVFLIEHDMDVVAKVSDWVVCMAEGRIVAEGDMGAIRNNPAVIDAYLGPPSGRAEPDSASAGRALATTAAPQHPKDAEAAPEAEVFAFEGRGIVAGYVPGIDILNGCDIEARPGEIVGVLGPNGAGKSTLLKSVFGQASIRQGQFRLFGEPIAGVPAHELASRGIGYVPQLDDIFATLSVEENLRMGLYLRPGDWRQRSAAVLELFPGLKRLLRSKGYDLSGGERKLLAMARAMMMEPRVLLLDEPSAGLAPTRRQELFQFVSDISASGVSIVIVEQNARQCLRTCDRGYVLDHGRNVYSGTGDALLHDPRVIELYLGSLGAAKEDRGGSRET